MPPAVRPWFTPIRDALQTLQLSDRRRSEDELLGVLVERAALEQFEVEVAGASEEQAGAGPFAGYVEPVQERLSGGAPATAVPTDRHSTTDRRMCLMRPGPARARA
jgi:hypothetical protein